MVLSFQTSRSLLWQSNRMLTRLVFSLASRHPPSALASLGCKPFHVTRRFSSEHFSSTSVLPEGSFQVLPNFITEAEEASLVEECSTYVQHLKYEFDHWDGVICGYRETEKSRWSEQNADIVERMRSEAFGKDVTIRPRVHVLDLAADGFIKPHVDAVKFCGDIISGLSLLSDCIMRLTHEQEPTSTVDIYLPQRSLYIMKGDARYLYNHAILRNEESFFQGRHVKRGRRISFICRQPVHAPVDPLGGLKFDGAAT